MYTKRELIAAACNFYASHLEDAIGDLPREPDDMVNTVQQLRDIADEAEKPPEPARPSQAKPRPPFPVRAVPLEDDEPPF